MAMHPTDESTAPSALPHPDTIRLAPPEPSAADARIASLEAALGRVHRQLEQNDQEIDALQIAAARGERRWFKDPSIMIAALALLFSFGTTAVAMRRTAQQDVHDSRTELRSLIQRLNALPRENMELATRFDRLAAGQLSGFLYAEQTFLAKQAAEVASEIPRHVSSAEYVSIANALTATGNFVGADRMLTRALAAADNLADEIAAHRMRAFLHFVSGDRESGRREYQRALDRMGEVVTTMPGQVEWMNAFTHMNWASSEANVRECRAAGEHIQTAIDLAARLTNGPQTQAFQQQLAELRTQIQMCS